MDLFSKMRFIKLNARAVAIEKWIAEALKTNDEVFLGQTSVGGSNYSIEELCLRNGWGCVELPDKKIRVSDCMTIGFCGKRDYLLWVERYKGKAVKLDYKPTSVKPSAPNFNSAKPMLHLEYRSNNPNTKPDGEPA